MSADGLTKENEYLGAKINSWCYKFESRDEVNMEYIY